MHIYLLVQLFDQFHHHFIQVDLLYQCCHSNNHPDNLFLKKTTDSSLIVTQFCRVVRLWFDRQLLFMDTQKPLNAVLETMTELHLSHSQPLELVIQALYTFDNTLFIYWDVIHKWRQSAAYCKHSFKRSKWHYVHKICQIVGFFFLINRIQYSCSEITLSIEQCGGNDMKWRSTLNIKLVWSDKKLNGASFCIISTNFFNILRIL